jgi:hypothetical protein
MSLRITASSLTLLSVLISAPIARADIIFDNSAGATGTTFRGPGFDPGTFITLVAVDTFISDFQILNRMNSAGNLKFLIFDDATSALLYSSPAIPFPSDNGSFTWKTSPTINFTLLAGHKYDIGSIADVAADYPFEFGRGSFTQHFITSSDANANFSGFAIPTLSGHAAADIPLRLEVNAAVVPEPTSLILFGTGSLGLIGCTWRRQKCHPRRNAGTRKARNWPTN